MPFVARPEDLRLALFALVAAAGGGIGGRFCAQTMEAASDAVAEAPGPVVRAAGAADPTAARFGAGRVLASVCQACRACPRGQGADDPQGEAAVLMTRLRRRRAGPGGRGGPGPAPSRR